MERLSAFCLVALTRQFREDCVTDTFSKLFARKREY